MTTMTEAPAFVAGVYPDMPEAEYHADPVPGGSLSSTGARKLLAPSCPAKFKYERDNGRAPKREFDLGHATHKLVLGKGADIIEIDAATYRTTAAQDQRDAAYADGLVPLLPKELAQVEAMAKAVRDHPIAGPLFTPGTGQAELSGFWQDQRTGIWRRFRTDWVKNGGDRTIAVDLKTTVDASPEALERAIYNLGYNQQAAWYLDGLRAVGLADHDAQFMFVFVEKTPPYLITVTGLDLTSLRIGAARNARAIDRYRECTETGHWPAYVDGVTYLSLPPWAEKNDTEEYL